ncbi:hypothetical protein OUZ56_014858 [Daphnia magna]|uniref:Transmembrane protein n=1 Tax=Daphnia magna TaxID=35525 RepID=A0ABR0AL14_9CRUS|nr:hypothetical protein OUZ56_014858 [Daphnia magna]
MTTRHDMGHQRYRQRHLFLPTVSRNTITSLIPLKEMRNSAKRKQNTLQLPQRLFPIFILSAVSSLQLSVFFLA